MICQNCGKFMEFVDFYEDGAEEEYADSQGMCLLGPVCVVERIGSCSYWVPAKEGIRNGQQKMNQGAVVVASCAPKGVRRRPRCRGYEGVITKVDGEFVTVRFGNGSMRKYHKSNLSFLNQSRYGEFRRGFDC